MCARGEQRIRESNGFGEEPIAVADPGRPNDLEKLIQRLENDWFAKVPHQVAAVQPVVKYMYLTREQDCLSRTTSERARHQCDSVLPEIHTPPLRTLENSVATPAVRFKRAWLGEMLR